MRRLTSVTTAAAAMVILAGVAEGQAVEKTASCWSGTTTAESSTGGPRRVCFGSG